MQGAGPDQVEVLSIAQPEGQAPSGKATVMIPPVRETMLLLGLELRGLAKLPAADAEAALAQVTARTQELVDLAARHGGSILVNTGTRALLGFAGAERQLRALHVARIVLEEDLGIAAATLLLYYGLATGPMTIVSPIAGSYPALVVGFEVLAGLRPSPIQWLAMAATLLGAIAVARAGAMTDDSKKEQGGLGLDRLSARDFERFERANAAYAEKFGFPFIVCVRNHGSAESILSNFEQRVGNDYETELSAALGEIGKITRLRLDARMSG